MTVSRGDEIAHQLKNTLRRQLPQLGHVLIHSY
ncbi:cation transporter dimerization domain-containing protein [Runella zeae]|nr:cation transporter dimerization domain-containing protein [Runella zeae]